MVCAVRLGPYLSCGGALENRTDRLGRVTPHCERCERRALGICRDCPRTVYGTVGKCLFCRACKKRQFAVQTRKWNRANAKHKNRLNRQYRKRRKRKNARPSSGAVPQGRERE